MLRTKLVSYNELPENLKEDYSESHEYDYFLLVYHRNELIFHKCDHMEPEDAIFCRDLNWIPGMLEKAYKLGLKDGNSLDYL